MYVYKRKNNIIHKVIRMSLIFNKSQSITLRMQFNRLLERVEYCCECSFSNAFIKALASAKLNGVRKFSVFEASCALFNVALMSFKTHKIAKLV